MMVPTYDAYTSTTSEEIEKAREMQRKQDKLESMQEKLVLMYDVVFDYLKLNEPIPGRKDCKIQHRLNPK